MKSSRLVLIGVSAAAVVGGALLIPLTATAAPVKYDCDEGGNCHQACTQDLPNGDTVYYEHGTTITVRDGKSGKEYTFKCNDGNWESTRTVVPGSRLDKGNIGMNTVDGVSGDTGGTGTKLKPFATTSRLAAR